MPLTLIEAAKLADTLTQPVIEEYANTSDILAAIPFRDLDGAAYAYNREYVLPGVAFRGINEGYTESTGIINPQVESLKITGGDLDVDTFILNTQGEGVRAAHEMMKVKSLALQWTRAFIKGDSRTDPRTFDGLQARLTGTQIIDNAVAGAPLSLLKLDELIDQVSDPTHLIMSKTARRSLTAAQRNINVGGFVQQQYNEDMGRQMSFYNDLPILIVWQDASDVDILDYTEASGNNTTFTNSSIYCVSFGDMMLEGLQGRNSGGSYGIYTQDLGELETKPVKRTRVEWSTAIAVQHGRSAARLRGVQQGAVTV